jgi:predicted RNA binding protein YcfA (HicA-like mRNA interferase family)
VPKITPISGSELIKVLQRAGFEVIRQRGSHVSLSKGEYRTVVPLHDEIAPGTLADILRQCGLTHDMFFRWLKQ